MLWTMALLAHDIGKDCLLLAYGFYVNRNILQIKEYEPKKQ